MTNENEKEGVVIDVTPEQEPEPTPEPEVTPEEPVSEPKPEKAASSSRGTIALIIASLTIVVVGVILVLGFRHWTGLKNDLSTMNQQLERAVAEQRNLQSALEQAKTSISEQETQLTKQVLVTEKQNQAIAAAKQSFEDQKQFLADESIEMQSREAELRATVADVHRRVGRSGTQWMVAEAEYLMGIANHRLALERDVETAQLALKMADQRLHDTQDPSWNLTREQVARDISNLASVNLPDAVGISAQLKAMIEQVPKMKLSSAHTKLKAPTVDEASDTPRSERNWDTLLNDIASGFENAIRIRKRDAPISAMIEPEHQFFIYENLKLQLEAARLALVRENQTFFNDNIMSAKSWIMQHFDQRDALTRNSMNALQDLLLIDIKPKLPDISQSLNTLKVRKQLMNATSSTSAEEVESAE